MGCKIYNVYYLPLSGKHLQMPGLQSPPPVKGNDPELQRRVTLKAES